MISVESLGVIIIVVCSILQFIFLISTKKRLNIFKDIFPESKHLDVDINEYSQQVQGIKTAYKNPVFNTIIASLNEYLSNNQGAVVDFNLMKDIIERNSDAVEEEIDSQISLPINIGLMGTMVGIIFGVRSLVKAGTLTKLVAGNADNIDGIITLLDGVGIAMITSIIGIIVSTYLTISFKLAKKEVEEEKNTFLTWIQSKLLPKLSSDFASVINEMTLRLGVFNESFASNVSEINTILEEVRDTTRGQVDLLKTVEQLKINRIATANIAVYEKLKDCTDEIGALGEMLSASKDYVKSVTKLNDKLDKSDERIKTIEEIGKFFIQERSNFSIVNKYLGQTEEALFESIKIFRENTEKQFGELVVHTNEQRKRYENVIAEETDALKNRMKELSMITEELKNLSAVKATMGNLEKATKEQNAKIDALTKSIKELASIKTVGGTSSPLSFWSLLPKWGKIVILIFLGFIVFTCIAHIVFNILALVLK